MERLETTCKKVDGGGKNETTKGKQTLGLGSDIEMKHVVTD